MHPLLFVTFRKLENTIISSQTSQNTLVVLVVHAKLQANSLFFFLTRWGHRAAVEPESFLPVCPIQDMHRQSPHTAMYIPKLPKKQISWNKLWCVNHQGITTWQIPIAFWMSDVSINKCINIISLEPMQVFKKCCNIINIIRKAESAKHFF